MPVNGDQFLRELEAEVDALFAEDVPNAVDAIALQIRQDAEDATEVREGHLKRAWMAGPVVTVPRKDPSQEPGGEAAAREALAGRRPGDSVFIYNNVFYGYFREFGTVKHAPHPMLQPALQRAADVEIRL